MRAVGWKQYRGGRGTGWEGHWRGEGHCELGEREESVCKSLSGYYSNSTGLSISFQNHLLRRLELLSL